MKSTCWSPQEACGIKRNRAYDTPRTVPSAVDQVARVLAPCASVCAFAFVSRVTVSLTPTKDFSELSCLPLPHPVWCQE